jgi:zinc transport system substrate-binding protein
MSAVVLGAKTFAAEAPPPAKTSPLSVVVGIPPMASLVERIAGGRAEVQVIVAAGACVHDVAITPRQAIMLGKADLFVTVGLPFETRLAEKLRQGGTATRFLDATQGIRKRPLTQQEASCCPRHEHHSHHHQHAECSPVALDAHVWLAPPLAKTLARNIAGALADMDAVHAGEYRANLTALLKELDLLDEKLRETLAPFYGQTIYAYHPAFGYLAETYGLKQKTIESEGKVPSARRLRELVLQARADQAKVFLVEPQADQRAAAMLAQAVGGKLLRVDPLAKNLLKNLEEIANQIAAELAR